MNYMPEVAKLLGVEIGEEFNIDDKVCKYKFTDSCLMWHNRFDNCWIDGSHRLNDLIIGKNKIIKLSKPILDEVEKKYLSRVIRPFRDSVVAILKETKKEKYSKIKREIIVIVYDDDWRIGRTELPDFKKGTMYKGMIVGKRYHLKELGL